MNATNKFALLIIFVIGAALLLFFSGSPMTPSGGMGSGGMNGISWMWVPLSFLLGLGVFVWVILVGLKK